MTATRATFFFLLTHLAAYKSLRTGLITLPFLVLLMEAMATVKRILLPIRVPRLEILFRSPLNFPDCLTEGSRPKNAVRALGELKRLKSPISAISVAAVKKPTPGISSRSSIFRFALAGNSLALIINLTCDSMPFKVACMCSCLLYTSDAAAEEDSVDLGGRRIIKKKKKK